MTDFALYGIGGLANGAGWSSRVYATGSVAEATAATAIHSAWDALWGDIQAYLPAVSTLTETLAVTLNPSWKFTTGTSNSEDLVGTSASDSMPISTCAVITWRTLQRNKKGRGRSFLPAAAVNAVATAADTGELLPAFRAACTTGGIAFLSALTAAGLTPVILNRATLTTTPISLGNTGILFRSQRRRQSKVTNNYA